MKHLLKLYALCTGLVLFSIICQGNNGLIVEDRIPLSTPPAIIPNRQSPIISF